VLLHRRNVLRQTATLSPDNSERLLQQDLGPLTVQNQTSFGPPALPAPPPSAAVVKAATVAHYRRLVSAALANNISPASYLMAIRELTGGS
jgi:hypothetical protein